MKNIINLNVFMMRLLCVLLIVLLVFLFVRGSVILGREVAFRSHSTLDSIDQRMDSLFFEINDFPRQAGDDVLFLSKLYNLKMLINEKGNVDGLEQDFLAFLEENSVYYQLRYINENGDEVVRVDFDEDGKRIIEEDFVQNKQDRYYFKETMMLSKGEVFISRLDLNMENEKIEVREKDGVSNYIPVIRYATPVFDDMGDRRGIVISNVYADYFLEDIRRAQRSEEYVFLVDSSGYYLAHPNRSKEFGFMFNNEAERIQVDYSEVSDELFVSPDERRIRPNGLIFSLRYIYPTISSFEVYRGSEKAMGNNSEDKYYWVLVTVSEKTDVVKELNLANQDYLFLFGGFGFALLIVFILISVLGRNYHDKN